MKTCFQQPYGIIQIGCKYPLIAFRPPMDITPKDLISIVSIHFSISEDIIIGQSRKRQYVDIRRMTISLFKTCFPEMSLKRIGSFFSGMDHSTIIYSLKTFNALIETEKEYLEKYLSVKAVIDEIISPRKVEN